jgi:hypothetical protein
VHPERRDAANRVVYRPIAHTLGVLVALLALAVPASAAGDASWSLGDPPFARMVLVARAATATPANTAAPAIGGAVTTGSILTTTTGTWTQAPTAYTYQWQKDAGSGFVNITGAVSSTYTLAAGDTGTSIRVVVTAANSVGSTSANAPAVGPVDAAVPTNNALPLVTGSLQRGQTLVASPGTWNPPGTTYSHQWQRDTGTGFANIAGATGSMRVLTTADVAASMRVVVTATNAYGSTSATSLATAAVQPVLPAATQSPTVTGTTKRTFTLAATSGVWTPAGVALAYRWQRDTGSGFTDISGATASTYTLVTADVGARVRITVVGTNPDGSTTAASAPSAVVLGAVPSPVTSPVLAGANRAGQTLTGSDGTWSPAATSFAYQWQRDAGAGFVDIAGATTSSYTAVVADAGARLRLQVTGTNAEGNVVAYSGATGVVTNPPTFSVAPAAPTGTLLDTATLTADAGTYTPSSAVVTFEWLRCPVGATSVTGSCQAVGVSSMYKLQGDDVGHPMGVRVTASSPGGATAAVSPVTAAVAGRPLNDVTLPQVGGTVEVAGTARVTPGTWSVPTRTVRYQWMRCDASGTTCADIPGAAADRYNLSTADRNTQVAVREIATSPGQTSSATSIPVTVADQPLPAATVLPVIKGELKRTSMLNATEGDWVNTPTRFAYQWRRCAADGSGCTDIAGATKLSFVLTQADVGSALTVVVSATNTSGTVSAVAAPTAPVVAVPPVNRTPPSITGTLQVPALLQAVKSSWQTTTDTRYALQWLRCDNAGAACSAIAGATGQAYKLAPGDADHTVRVRQTATNVDASLAVTSAATGLILPPAPSVGVYPHLAINGAPVQAGRMLTLTPATWFNTTATAPQFWRCAPTCVLLSTGGAWTYTIVAADAGAILRASERATGPGGVRTAYAPQFSGPVRSGAVGMSLIAPSGMSLLRTASGTALASASIGAPVAGAARVIAAAAAGTRTVRISVRRAAGVRGVLRAWACPVPLPADGQPCTKAVALGSRATLRLAIAGGARVRVVVARRH